MFKEVLLSTLFALLLALAFFSGVSYVFCDDYGRVTGKATKHTVAACYIKTDSGWQSWSEYKARITASEVLNHAE